MSIAFQYFVEWHVTNQLDAHLTFEVARFQFSRGAASECFKGGFMKRLQGKVAVVTGGNSGIGLASAQRLKEEGASVGVTGRSKKTLDEGGKMLGSDVLAIHADVS